MKPPFQAPGVIFINCILGADSAASIYMYIFLYACVQQKKATTAEAAKVDVGDSWRAKGGSRLDNGGKEKECTVRRQRE